MEVNEAMEHVPLNQVVTEEQMNNLRKLQSYLKGELKAEFNMKFFDGTKMTGVGFHSCGSVGCAVGHGPYAGVEKFENEPWSTYAERCFGSHNDTSWPLYLFLFSCGWGYYNNTPEGVVKRIQYVFDHGVPMIDSTREGHQLMEKHNGTCAVGQHATDGQPQEAAKLSEG